ncbi:MAG TPA: hypothetical protein VF417_03415, partial [Candidatus Methylomirabilis sp.]
DVGMGLGQAFAGLAIVMVTSIVFVAGFVVLSLVCVVRFARKGQKKARRVAYLQLVACFAVLYAVLYRLTSL